MTEAVEDGRADLGIGPLPPEWSGARLELGWEQLILVMPLSDPLAQTGHDLALESLSGRQWVLYEEGHGLGEQALQACRAAGFEPEWAVRTAQVEVAARLAAAGIGPALVPIKNVPPELAQHVRGVDPPVELACMGLRDRRGVPRDRRRVRRRARRGPVAAAGLRIGRARHRIVNVYVSI